MAFEFPRIFEQPNDRIPSEAEEALIRQALGKAQSDLDSLQDKISRVKTEILSLEAQSVQRAIHIDHLRAAIAPHKRLPPETLATIFTHASSRHNSSIQVPYRFKRPELTFPWFLAAVCARWHQVVMQEPRLWCDFVLEYGCMSPEVIHRVREVFRRSGQSLLTLRINTDSSESKVIRTFLEPNIDRKSVV